VVRSGVGGGRGVVARRRWGRGIGGVSANGVVCIVWTVVGRLRSWGEVMASEIVVEETCSVLIGGAARGQARGEMC